MSSQKNIIVRNINFYELFDGYYSNFAGNVFDGSAWLNPFNFNGDLPYDRGDGLGMATATAFYPVNSPVFDFVTPPGWDSAMDNLYKILLPQMNQPDDFGNYLSGPRGSDGRTAPNYTDVNDYIRKNSLIPMELGELVGPTTNIKKINFTDTFKHEDEGEDFSPNRTIENYVFSDMKSKKISRIQQLMIHISSSGSTAWFGLEDGQFGGYFYHAIVYYKHKFWTNWHYSFGFSQYLEESVERGSTIVMADIETGSLYGSTQVGTLNYFGRILPIFSNETYSGYGTVTFSAKEYFDDADDPS